MNTKFTEEEAKEANWPCRMCEYEPAKQGSSVLPKICKNCDCWKNIMIEENSKRYMWKKETSKPNNFELLKRVLIPTKNRGEKGWTMWELQKLRDKGKK